MHHSTCIYDIIHVDEKVFVSLANGEIVIYTRDFSGLWNTYSPHKIQVATNVAPISKMLLVDGKLWGSTLNSIAIIGTTSLEVESSFPVGSDLMRHVTAMVRSGHGVWIAVQSSPIIHLYHSTLYIRLLEINVTAAVTKMLNAYDEIIRQHKLVCLRVTSLCVEKDTLWIGTSAGVALTLSVPHLTPSTTQVDITPNITGMPHGHVGHVRFLTNICATSGRSPSITNICEGGASCDEQPGSSSSKDIFCPNSSAAHSAMVINGGDGYENLGSNVTTDILGCDDSTSHLLMWRV